MLLFALLSCTAPEDRASDIAIKFASTAPDDAEALHALVCSDEKAAKSVDEIKAGFASASSLLGPKWDEMKAQFSKLQWRVKSATLAPSGTEGEIVVVSHIVEGENAGKDGAEKPVKVRLEGEVWCAVPGWAEEKRLGAVEKEISDLVDKATSAATSWSFDEADKALVDADGKLSQLPDTWPSKVTVSTGVTSTRTFVDALRKDWVGGRWRVTETIDPMTDEHNVVATLQSTQGLPNVIGQEKPASIIVRCKRDKLEVYVTTDSMLDSDWRYDSVSGQHRFGAEPATRFSGNVSTDRKAVFLPKARVWIEQFQAHEGDGWAVELPLYGRSPATAKFDLTAAGTALKRIPADCG